MADTRTPEQRRRIMQSVATRDTGPEMTVRRLLHGLGYRYRLHTKKLPGKPDIVFPGRKKAIFVHGCFWHGHGCTKGQLPKSHRDYWGPKLMTNKARDAEQVIALQSLGWSVLTVWQCETTISTTLTRRLVRFIEGRPKSATRRK
jgi:DNA mismatch endonuclease (patch repair protein)